MAFYNNNQPGIDDAKTVRDSNEYKQHIESLKKISEIMGLSIKNIESTIGGFENNKGEKITEVSNRIHLDESVSLEDAEKLAAVIGATRPEIQESTIAAKYIEHGKDNQTAIELEIPVDDINKAIIALRKSGINDYEISEDNKSIKILDFSNGKDDDFSNNIINFTNNLTRDGIKFKEPQYRAIESKYVDPQRRSELLTHLESEAGQRQSGSDLHNLYKEAKEKSDKFLSETPHNKEKQSPGRVKRLLQNAWRGRCIQDKRLWNDEHGLQQTGNERERYIQAFLPGYIVYPED